MKLEKAIEILEDRERTYYRNPDHDYRDAQKLLIEAGKRIKSYRDWGGFAVGEPLPGEDPSDPPQD